MLPNLVRYILSGPILGACIGLIQVVVAADIWVAHGQPDFYFRGWPDVQSLCELLFLGGGIAGFPFGAMVRAGEFLFDRQVRVVFAFVLTVVATTATAWATVEIEFARRELLPAYVRPGLSVAIAGALLVASSRPTGTHIP